MGRKTIGPHKDSVLGSVCRKKETNEDGHKTKRFYQNTTKNIMTRTRTALSRELRNIGMKIKRNIRQFKRNIANPSKVDIRVIRMGQRQGA